MSERADKLIRAIDLGSPGQRPTTPEEANENAADIARAICEHLGLMWLDEVIVRTEGNDHLADTPEPDLSGMLVPPPSKKGA